MNIRCTDKDTYKKHVRYIIYKRNGDEIKVIDKHIEKKYECILDRIIMYADLSIDEINYAPELQMSELVDFDIKLFLFACLKVDTFVQFRKLEETISITKNKMQMADTVQCFEHLVKITTSEDLIKELAEKYKI